MTRHDEEQAIGRDMVLIALIEAIGDRKAKAKARKQRKAISEQIAAWNKADGLDQISDDELLADLRA